MRSVVFPVTTSPSGSLNGSSGVAGLLGHGGGSGHHRPDGGVHLGLLHQQPQLVHRLVPTAALAPSHRAA